MTAQLASHISSMSRSTKPGFGVMEAVATTALPISVPFRSNSAALVAVPPLSSPIK